MADLEAERGAEVDVVLDDNYCCEEHNAADCCPVCGGGDGSDRTQMRVSDYYEPASFTEAIDQRNAARVEASRLRAALAATPLSEGEALVDGKRWRVSHQTDKAGEGGTVDIQARHASLVGVLRQIAAGTIHDPQAWAQDIIDGIDAGQYCGTCGWSVEAHDPAFYDIGDPAGPCDHPRLVPSPPPGDKENPDG